MLREEDVLNISDYLRIPIEEVKTDYLQLDEDNDWTFNGLPSPFLGEENDCQIYESGPKDCREFPHANKSVLPQGATCMQRIL